MKKKFLSLFSFILVISICLSAYSPVVLADGESCKEYDAYFYFASREWGSSFWDENGDAKDWDLVSCTTASGDCSKGGDGTFILDFSELNLPEGSTITEVSGSGEQISIDDSMTSFWTRFNELAKKSDTVINGSTLLENGKFYAVHGIYSDDTGANIWAKDLEYSALEKSKASFSSDITTIYNPKFKQKGDVIKANFTVKRSFTASAYNKIKDNSLQIGNATGGILYAPALYKTTFNVCTPVKDPTLTINYWYDEVGKKKASDSYQEVIKAGSKYEKESPKIEGWTPDKDVVRGTMPDEDLVIDVIYTPKTGGVAMGFIWFIGFLGLGYGIYYYKKTVRDEEEI